MKFLFIIIILFLSLFSLAQKSVFIDFGCEANAQKKEFNDSISLNKYLDDIQQSDFANGFLYAKYSYKQVWSDSCPKVSYIRGKRVFLKSISRGNADLNILYRIGFNKKKVKKSGFLSTHEIEKIQEKIVSNYENNGHPFARVSFNIDSIQNDSVWASWHVDEGPPILFDSIVQKGKFNFINKFLTAWLGIEKNKPYDERKIHFCKRRLEMSEFVEQERPLQVHFSEGKAKLYLFLKKKRSSQFDGIFGFAPDVNNPTKIIFNGDINLRLINSFNHADNISFKWKSSAEKSQEINIRASVPFLFGFPVGVNGFIDIFRKDTLYVKTLQHYGVSFFSGILSEIEFFAENIDTRVIDKTIYISAKKLPIWADSRTTSGGLRVLLPFIDNTIIPKNGYIFDTKISIGQKHIFKNSQAPKTIYDGIDIESIFYGGESELSIYRQIYKYLYAVAKSNFSLLHSSKLFENDLFLIGGLNNLRGFDERSIAASAFSVSEVELRFFIEKSSYITLFSDYGIVRQLSVDNFSNKYYFSMGTGLVFSTKAGVFNIFYAIGKENPGSFSLRNGKIHFGFAARF